MSSTGPPDKLDREIVVVASVVVIGAIMSILDTTIVNVALATLGRNLRSLRRPGPQRIGRVMSVVGAAVPRATTALNVLQRVGGSIGTALLAVVLEDRIRSAVPGGSAFSGGAVKPIPPAVRERVAATLAHAFASTFWWAVALTALALMPGAVLAWKVHSGSRSASPAAQAA
jgi:hypothetical protein